MTLAEIKLDPCASYWLQHAARDLDQRDPVDALNDIDVLKAALQSKLDAMAS